ncbi:MAG: hypothetical protein L0241_10905 [Planctomycetia bacterium]|nr:hypothetical protein [Planctomycetia bacterium]
MMTATSPTVLSAVAELILTRLAVPSSKPPSPGVVRKDVGKVLGHTLATDEYTELTNQLRAEGLVEPRPRSRGGVQLTSAGRERALTFLGVTALPARTNWKLVRAKYLFPKALGVSSAEVEKLTSADRVTAFLLRREYDLPAVNTPAQALEALVCKELGRNETTLSGLFRAVLSEVLGSEEQLSKKDLVKQFPRKLTGAKSGKLDDIRQTIIRKWLSGTPTAIEPDAKTVEPDAKVADFDLPVFAATVKRLARDCPPAGRFGDNKAFISAVWRESQTEDGFPKMPLEEFKAQLVAANQAGLLRLEPADLVQAMNPALVSESETTQAGAVFHFILIEEARS